MQGVRESHGREGGLAPASLPTVGRYVSKTQTLIPSASRVAENESR